MSSPKRGREQAEPFLDTVNNTPDQDLELYPIDDEPHANDRTPVRHYRQPRHVKNNSKSPWLIGLALFVAVICSVINTEATEYVETTLGWKKPMATMYITHSSLTLPWIVQLLYSRVQRRNVSSYIWIREYTNQLRDSITTIDAYASQERYTTLGRKGTSSGPFEYLTAVMANVMLALTVSGCCWFIALAFTTPADLTAIYNCSTFFAAAFSVPILKERLGWYSIIAVALSVMGTFIIAYGDTTAERPSSEGDSATQVGSYRLFGNLVACLGALGFGLYEVLFKKWACSSRVSDATSSLPLTLAASALTGIYTFATLWLLLIVLHVVGVETLEWPSLHTWLWIIIAVLSGCIAITLLAVLVIWTNPVFGSFANVLSMAFVAFSDWLLFGLAPSAATYTGGGIVVVAFVLLTWETFHHTQSDS